MLDMSGLYRNVVGAAARQLDRQGREAREERLRRSRSEQSRTVDHLRALGVVKFRRRAASLESDGDEQVGFLGDLRFVVGPHGSIKVEGYIDPDKAVGLAKLYR